MNEPINATQRLVNVLFEINQSECLQAIDASVKQETVHITQWLYLYIGLSILATLIILLIAIFYSKLKDKNNKQKKDIEVRKQMEELRKAIFDAQNKYVEAYIAVKKQTLKTGEFDDDEMFRVQSQVTAEINRKIDEAKVRLGLDKAKKKGFFG